MLTYRVPNWPSYFITLLGTVTLYMKVICNPITLNDHIKLFIPKITFIPEMGN
jgi:hypothetical protein